jgi:Ca2+-binding RTX toxin-like protein
MRRYERRLATVLVGLAALALSALPAEALPAAAKAPVIDFTRDSAGLKPNGFTSVDSSVTHLSDSQGAELSVTNLGDTIGQGVSIRNDDASSLIITFDVPVTSLSLVFGNDDPGFTQAGDVARLNAFRKGSLFDSASVVLNRNDLPDQTIKVRGAKIGRAEFVYARGDAPINLIETVDDIQFTTRCTVKGTNGRDRLIGTAGGNGICGYDAKDRIFARGGNDAVFGGIGNDRIQGGPGGDTLEGGQGGDVIKAIDGVQGNDTVYGGPGADTCFVDNGDATKGCEDIRLPV